MGEIVYYSSESGNTKRFVERLGLPATRLPISPKDGTPKVERPYVLFVPTYAGGDGSGAVAKGVIRFLNDPENRRLIRGVVASGNMNFGAMYCLAGKIVAAKCGVPLLYKYELLGTADDLENVRSELGRFWETQLT